MLSKRKNGLVMLEKSRYKSEDGKHTIRHDNVHEKVAVLKQLDKKKYEKLEVRQFNFRLMHIKDRNTSILYEIAKSEFKQTRT